ncbi:MAG TPA: M14 family metallopeptidase [Flavipsychrobacter sp.]|nr:M14 family metallopeptidase [Flavipsychrobacter sp.]
MRNIIFLISFLSFSIMAEAQLITKFEQSKGLETATYNEVIAYYQQLDKLFPTIKMEDIGPTDADYPLNAVYYDKDRNFDIKKWKAEGKLILLINNGIHPGEPDGVDASMMLLRDAADGKMKIPDNIVLAVIPVYNIGGALNRNSYSRANQNGPEAYGFRGNAENLDLNRDFIKCDANETSSLVQLFHRLDPDLFIDNHVSDGADYQHVMTLLVTQHNKLGGEVGKYMNDTLVPLLYKDMQQRGYDLVPYVNDFEATPENGWTEFYDLPRFSSGFASLFQTFAFVPETHMLKPYKQRVDATYALMESFIKTASENADAIKAARAEDRKTLEQKTELDIDWKPDTTKSTMITFKGYESGYKPSKVSGMPRLYYDRSKPYTRQVKFYNQFTASKTVIVPKAYVISHGWHDVIQRLEWNGVKMDKLEKDTTMQLTVYRIEKYETVQHPYEKHYLHKNAIVSAHKETIKLLKGDYIIPTDQPTRRYLVETLEPTAPDAFFAWNFFDAVLQQKEGYSDYVFEDEAAELLKKNPELQKMLDEKKKSDEAFAKNGDAQLKFVYQHSPYFEPEFMRYPVFKIEQ